jgi:hypothetical protein
LCPAWDRIRESYLSANRMEREELRLQTCGQVKLSMANVPRPYCIASGSHLLARSDKERVRERKPGPKRQRVGVVGQGSDEE